MDRVLSQSPLPAPFTLEQIKQVAKTQDSTIVEYSVIYDNDLYQGPNKIDAQESELYIWVVKPTGEVAFRQVDLKLLRQKENTSLEDLVSNARLAIGSRSRGTIAVKPRDELSSKQRFQRLHQLLIQPIADFLPSDPNARVTFIPHKFLFLVPFAALQESDSKYLIEKHTLLTAPSIHILQLTPKAKLRVSRSLSRDVLIVGNPTMPSIPPAIEEQPQPLPSLPGAEQEAKDIAQLFNTKALIGDQATESVILQQLPKARIVHLATHGLLDNFNKDELGEHPFYRDKGIREELMELPGAIALAPGGSDDGLLTPEEILGLDLNAELVVLSACDTGRGRIAGDGVLGLSRSVIGAGVPSLIVSLWSVPDAPTASLMTQFYTNLQQKPDKAQALRQAMLTTMKQHPDPRNWAAFTLIGEP